MVTRLAFFVLALSPHHFVDDAGVALDDFDDLRGDVFFDVVGHGGSVVAVGVHRDCGIDGLEQRLFVDSRDKEARLVERFRAFRAGADADCRERMAHTREEGAFFGQRTAVTHDGECVHLQAVVVVEAEGFMLNHALVKLEAACSQTVSAARVAAIQNRHVILFGHLVDGGKEAREVLLGVDILFAMSAEQNVLALFEPETFVNVASLDCRQILVQDFSHGAAGYVCAFLGESAVGQVAAGVFGVGHVYVADDVDDAAVGLFGQAFVLAAVAGFHVEDRNVQALRGNGREAAVGIAENEQCIGLAGDHQLVAAVDNVTDGSAEVVAHGIHVDFGILEAQVLEEHSVQIVVVVLAGVRQKAVEVLAALVDDCREADDFRAGAHDDQEFEFAVVGKFHVAVVGLDVHEKSLSLCYFPIIYSFLQAQGAFTTFSPKVSGWLGSNCSFAHMTVTRFSVSERLMMLWV